MNNLPVYFLSLLMLVGSTVVAEELDDVSLLQSNEPLISPTRLSQPLRDIPASVTVIDAHTIESLGFTRIVDALRLVPGFAVGMSSGSDFRVSYHGGHGMNPRRLQVLLDGMPIYQSGLAKVDWNAIGVSVTDVARIEVTRSPSSASYGANAFNAVVNIITKDPALTQGVKLKQMYSTQDAYESYIRYGGSTGATDYRITATSRGDKGFDENAVGEDRRDDTDLLSANIKSRTRLDDSTLDLQMGYVRNIRQIEYADLTQITFPDTLIRNNFLSASWDKVTSDKNSVKINASINRNEEEKSLISCRPLFFYTDEMRALGLENPELALAFVTGGTPNPSTPRELALLQAAMMEAASLGPLALTPDCGRFNQDFVDRSIIFEVQDTYVVNESFRYLAGFGNRQNRFDSETYVNGSVTNNNTYLFGTMEYKSDPMVINLGMMGEYQRDYTDGVELSPRAALNYHIDVNQTLKFIVSRATRTPDILENERDWNYFVRDLAIPVQGRRDKYLFFPAKSTQHLESEKILSQEISYFGNFPERGISVDLKLFREQMDDLISEKLHILDYHPTNNSWLDNKGADLEVRYAPSSRLRFGLSYAYLDSKTNHPYERVMYARHSGSIYSLWEVVPSVQLSAAYFGSNSISGYSYDRFDIGVKKTWNKMLSTSMRLSRVTDDQGFIITDSDVINRYDSPYETVFNVELSF